MNNVERISILDLHEDEQDILDQLIGQLSAKRGRNEFRADLYDNKHLFRSLGIATPPEFMRLDTVLGWPAKAVDTLNRRCTLEGFTVPGESVDDLGITNVWDSNHLAVEAPQSGLSSLVHSVAFLVTTSGDVESGEPEALITARDAMDGTGIWDGRKRALSSFLSVVKYGKNGQPADMVMYLPGVNVFMNKDANRWTVDRMDSGTDRVPVEVMPYKPRLRRPFGSSRISRPVISLTGMAVRTVVRSEIGGEFYSAPRAYALGADASAFQDADGNMVSQWQAIQGRVWAIGKDEEGDLPTVGQFPQLTQQPHMDQLRSLAQLFAGETSIPVSSLGISIDSNPTSAESYVASREDLIADAEGTTDVWSHSWEQAMLTALKIRDGWDEVPDVLAGLRAKWRSPIFTSRAAAADAGQKQLAAAPWLADTEVGLELLGLSASQIERAKADQRRIQGRAALTALSAAAGRDRTAGSDSPTS